MNRPIILSAATVATLILTAAPAQAQHWNRDWRTVAERRIEGRETDTIFLPRHVRVREVRVCTRRAALHLRDFQIRFDIGRRQDVNTRSVLAPGSCTRAVDVRGHRRDVRSIRLRYAPIISIGHRPTVRVQVR
jgi:hypothetical protein